MDIPKEIQVDIDARVARHFAPKRRALSLRYPRLAPVVVAAHRLVGDVRRLTPTHTLAHSRDQLPVLLYKHGALLRRKLGASDPLLQERKIENLQIAIRVLDGLIIAPGKTFSLWKQLGAITASKGYVEGMLLSEGRVQVGIGGGLCQLSNLLYWIFLHGPFTVVERHHHSFDPFPDSGRALPFGSGATIMDRILDLRARNDSSQPIQLRIWLSETHLYGALYAEHSEPHKFHVYEKHPLFIEARGTTFRYNRLYRDVLKNGAVLSSQEIATNFSPIRYGLGRPPDYQVEELIVKGDKLNH